MSQSLMIKTYKCDNCGRYFLSKYSRKTHDCKMIGQGYVSRDAALQAMREVRT